METLETLDDGAPAPNPKPPEPETLDPCPAQRRRRAEPRASRSGDRGPGRGRARASSDPVESASLETLVSSDSSSKENPFRVGDLVWGKIKGHLWWPGKVVDPSEQHGSMDHREEDRTVLVAFFGGGGGSFSWCEQSQLRPFKEGFNHMVKQSSSSSFVGAVKDALSEVRKLLDSEFACYCAVEKDPTKVSIDKRHFDEKYGVCNGVGTPPIAYCSPGQFLEHLRETARDVLVANMLEVTMFVSWAAAIKRSNCCSVHFREVYVDQAEECEPNGSGDADKKVEEDCQAPKHRLVKGPDISKESNRKKERSIAELIGVTESVKAESHDDQEEKENSGLSKTDMPSSSSQKRKKKAGTDKSPNVENGGPLAGEEMSSDRRERKKSKYLLPPFTRLGGHSKRPLSTTAAEDGMSWKETETSQATPPVSPSSSLKQGGKTALLLVDDGDSVEKILYEFLAAASDHLRLKKNHSMRPVKYFFDKFRSYAYTEGSEFESYKRILDGVENIDMKSSANKDMGDGSQKGKSSGRRIKRKAEANGNTSLEQGSDTNAIGKDKEAIVGTHLVLDLNHVNSPEEVKPRRKRRTKMSDAGGCGAGGEPLLDLMLESISPLKKAILQNRATRGKIADNDNSPFLKGHKLIYQSEISNSDKKKSRKPANGESVVTSEQVHANGPAESRPRQKEERMEGTKHRNVSSVPKSPTVKTPLPYIKRSLEKMISKLHGSAAHEKETGPSVRLRLEVEVNLLGEMECMLEKVNKLLTEPCAGTLI